MVLIQKGLRTTFDKNKLASKVFILQLFTHFVTFHTAQKTEKEYPRACP